MNADMNLETAKLEVMQQLLSADSAEPIEEVRALLRDGGRPFALTDAQKAGLDAQRLRHERGEDVSHSWEQVQTDAQKILAERRA